MYHKQLTNHILKQRSLGESDAIIRTNLKGEDWAEEDITIAFHYADNQDEVRHFSLKRFFQSEVKETTFLFVVLLSLSTSLFFYFQKREVTLAYELQLPVNQEQNQIRFTYGIQPNLSHPDFFAKIKNQLIEKNITFVEVNLSEMVARVYKNGTTTLEVKVKTKGKEGSWWETPAGLYKIETKEKTHYSSMGHVTQPWSMQFQGNFFIHGWPHYDDGRPVASTFSGGCIRLSDEDAKKIFDEVTVGTPILVYEKDFIPDAHTYSEIRPTIKAASFMVADILNNYIFLDQNRSASIPAENITKFMTALVATEYINIEKDTTIKSSSLVETKTPRLSAGMTINVYQLLFPLLRESSNEAAEAIASLYGERSFVKHMNEKAKAIGMNHTTFVDPTGTSAKNVTTPEDIFMLAKYIYNNRSFLFNITSGKVKTSTYGESIFDNLEQANELITQPSFFGGISGIRGNGTGYNMSVFELTVGGVKRPILFLSLDSSDSRNDVLQAKEFVLGRYR